MPREHDAIAMTTEEVVAFLRTMSVTALGTLDADGSPSCAMARFSVEGETLVVTVPAGSRPHTNVVRDPRVCCVIENAAKNYYENCCVSVHGTAVLRPSDPARPSSATFELALEDLVTFDFAKIQNRF